MAQAGDNVYKSFPEILADVLTAWVARIPDINISVGSVVEIWSEVFAKSGESFFLGLQLLHDDIFIQTMSALALQREGEELGRPQKGGSLASGEVTFEGAGGTFIATGSQVGAPRAAIGDTLVFETTDDATIPDPGVPTAPSSADSGSAGNVSGTIEYSVTFVTAEGETEIGAVAAPLVLAVAHQVNLTAIPVGGAGTTARKIYRRKNGGAFAFVHQVADNSTTTYTDNVADGSLGGAPPSVSTAERVTVAAQAAATGIDYDVATGAINTLVDVDGDVTSVTNAAPFTGGEDPEAIEAFRQALLRWKQNPQSGSASDLIAWATSIDGVDSAAVFKNQKLDGTTELGSVVVKISGPGGTVPGSDVITAVQTYLESKDLANITIYVGTFTPNVITVAIDVTTLDGYTVDDVTPQVNAAIETYINSIPVGGTVYVSGIVAATFSLPGIETVSVTSPGADVTSTASEKPTTDDAHITVS